MKRRIVRRCYITIVRHQMEKTFKQFLEKESGIEHCISDKDMEKLIFLQRFAGKFFYLPNPEKLQGGEKVKVTGGDYTGIEGEIYRLKGHKRLVVRLSNIVSVAMNEYIAKENLERIQ